MTFNTFSIDKAGNIDSVLKQNPKKSSVYRFMDIIKVFSSENSGSGQDPIINGMNLPASPEPSSAASGVKLYSTFSPAEVPIYWNGGGLNFSNTINNVLPETGSVIQFSSQELKDVSLLISFFENAKNIQIVGKENSFDNSETGKKEFFLSGDQLKSFFELIFAVSNNSGFDPEQFKKSAQPESPLTVTLSDGIDEYSVTVSLLQKENAGKEILSGTNVVNPAGYLSEDVFQDVLKYGVTGLSNKKLAVENNDLINNENQLQKNMIGQEEVLYKVEILQQQNTVQKPISTIADYQTTTLIDNILTPVDNRNGNKTVIDDKQTVPVQLDFSKPAEKVFADAVPDTIDLTPVEKITPLNKLAFDNESENGISAQTGLQQDTLKNLTPEEKAVLFKYISGGEIKSIEYSLQPVEPSENVFKLFNKISLLSKNNSIELQIKDAQPISKPAAVSVLANNVKPGINKIVAEQFSEVQKNVEADVSSSSNINPGKFLLDPTNNPLLAEKAGPASSRIVIDTLPDTSGERIFVKLMSKPNFQFDNSTAFEKEPSVGLPIKNEKELTQDSNNTKTDDVEGLKPDKQFMRDALTNQRENKDFANRNANDFQKNTLLPNSSGAAVEKTQFTPELKAVPDATKIIKANEIIPELSKIVQQGEKQTITFQLLPESLGKVKLTVDMVANNLNARIEVENEQVKQFIQSNIDQLKQNFQSNGIQLNTVNISLADYNQRNAKTFVPRKKFSSRYIKDETVEKTNSTVSRRSMGYNTYEFLA